MPVFQILSCSKNLQYYLAAAVLGFLGARVSAAPWDFGNYHYSVIQVAQTGEKRLVLAYDRPNSAEWDVVLCPIKDENLSAVVRDSLLGHPPSDCKRTTLPYGELHINALENAADYETYPQRSRASSVRTYGTSAAIGGGLFWSLNFLLRSLMNNHYAPGASFARSECVALLQSMGVTRAPYGFFLHASSHIIDEMPKGIRIPLKSGALITMLGLAMRAWANHEDDENARLRKLAEKLHSLFYREQWRTGQSLDSPKDWGAVPERSGTWQEDQELQAREFRMGSPIILSRKEAELVEAIIFRARDSLDKMAARRAR